MRPTNATLIQPKVCREEAWNAGPTTLRSAAALGYHARRWCSRRPSGWRSSTGIRKGRVVDKAPT
jgi:hypothetical protein